MNAYEKIIKTMREEAKNGVDLPSFGFAEMTSETSLNYNGLDFEEDDIVFAEHLKTREVKVTLNKTIETEKYPEPEEEPGHKHKVKINLNKEKVKVTTTLKEGDVVFGFIVDYDDDEKFLVLCKVGGV